MGSISRHTVTVVAASVEGVTDQQCGLQSRPRGAMGCVGLRAAVPPPPP